MPGKTPIILAKPPGERASARVTNTETVRLAPKPSSSTAAVSSPASTAEHPPPPPTRILKAKEDGGRSSSSPAPAGTPTTPPFSLPSPGILVASRDADDSSLPPFIPSAIITPAPKIHIQQKSSATGSGTSASSSAQQGDKSNQNEANSLDVRLAQYPEMKGSVKLMDEALQWCDQTFEFLQDQCEFLVVGVIGLQSTGKSTIMSLLAGSQGFKTSRSGVFKPQSKEQHELGEHCTRGIDIFVTNHRLILLDVQPMLSASVMDHMIQFEKKFPSEYSSTENALEIQSLQIAAFMLTVCHTVILVQDWFTDPNLLRFVQTAEMLRPSALLPSQDGGSDYRTEYCPHLVLVHNKCSPVDFEPSKVRLIQQTYSLMFDKSKLKFQGPIGIASGCVIPSLSPVTCGETINLFLMPWKDSANAGTSSTSIPEYKGHPGFDRLAEIFRQQIVSMPRSQMQPSTLTEKNWFHYAARTWETVKKSTLFMEYCRLLT